MQMNPEIFINSKFVENLGWTLAHSVWQIALIALVLFFILPFLRRFSANARYLAAVFALAVAAVLPIATFVQIAGNSSAQRIQIENAKDVITDRLNKKMPRPENLSILYGMETAVINAENKNIYAAVENSRRFFSENFAAVLPMVVGAWFLGIMFFALRLTGGAWQLHIYKTRGIAPPDEWRVRFLAVCEKLKIKQSVVFLQSNLIETPIAVGFLKPLILMPASVFLQISPAQLETIIAHELVHIRRKRRSKANPAFRGLNAGRRRKAKNSAPNRKSTVWLKTYGTTETKKPRRLRRSRQDRPRRRLLRRQIKRRKIPITK